MPILSSDHAASLTLEKARESQQLSLLRKEQGDIAVEAIITKLISELCRYVPNNLEPLDIAGYAKMIHKKYWYFKIDDIVLCFKNGISGDYGKIYGNLKYDTLAEWFLKYDFQMSLMYEDKASQYKEGHDLNRSSEVRVLNFIALDSKDLKDLGHFDKRK